MLKGLLRQKRFWALVVVALYTVFGFFIAPGIIERQILKATAKNLGREASIEKVRVNPYSLSLTLQGFELKDPDGTPFIAFDELYVNFQTSSLFRWAFTFNEFRLDAPRIHLRLLPDGRPNFADLIPEKSDEPPQPDGTQQKGMPRLIVADMQINQGRLQTTNLTRAEPEVVTFTPLDLRVRDLTTLPERLGSYTLRATGQGGGRWQWSGNLSVAPLRCSGSFMLTGTKLKEIWRVIKSRVNFEIMDGELGFQMDYSIHLNGDRIVARASDGSLQLTRLTVREKGKEPDLLTLETLGVTGINMRYPQQELTVGRVYLAEADILAWLTKAGDVNWLSLFKSPSSAGQTGVGVPGPKAAARTTTEGADPGSGPQSPVFKNQSGTPPDSAGQTAPQLDWTVSVDEFRLEDFTIGFEDRTTTPPFEVKVALLNVTLRNITSRANSLFDLDADLTIAEQGTFRIKGKVGAFPPVADANLRLSDVPVANLQPYLNPIAKLELVSGSLHVSGDAHLRADEGRPDIRFKGNLALRDFLTKDTLAKDRFISWKTFEFNDISFESKSLHIGEVRAIEPYGKIIIHKNRSTNLADVFRPRMAAADTAPHGRTEAPPEKSGAPISTKIERVRVVHGSADFADFSLILPFAVGIEDLNGEIHGLSSETLTRADVTLDGSFQPNGRVQVRGQINPLSKHLYTNLDIIFRDFDMPVLSPYSGHYIGRKFDKGKLSLDLKYKVSQRELLGDNKIVLDQLELGDHVESQDARTVPLDFAVALLKNRKGEIDLDVPVKGNLDDPKFRIIGVILKALANMVTKAVTSPFALLGELLGVEGTQLSYVSFEPGDSELTPTEHEKLVKLSEALNERPKLRLEVRGQTHPEEDAMAIRKWKFSKLAAERILSDPKKYKQPKGADGFSSRLLSDLYVEQFGKGALKELRLRFQVPVSKSIGAGERQKEDSKERVLDERAFYSEINRTLVGVQPINAVELRTLAMDRSRRIKDVLVQTGQVKEARVFLLDVDDKGKLQDGRVRLDLKITD